MRIINLIVICSLYLITSSSCNAQNDKNNEIIVNNKQDEIELYYFHLTNRCVTCKAVENISRKTITEHYKELVPFKIYNYQDKENTEIIKNLEVKGQSLFIIKGKKKVDLTREAFMYAKTSPDKFRKVIIEKIDSLL